MLVREYYEQLRNEIMSMNKFLEGHKLSYLTQEYIEFLKGTIINKNSELVI